VQLTIVRNNEIANASQLQGRSMKLALGAAFAAAGVLACSQAAADPRLDEKVYDPYIENHTAELEIRNGQEIGGDLGGERTTVLEGEYGLNDRVSLALVGSFAHAPGQGTDFSGIGLEGVVYLGRVPKLGIDTGLYLEYSKGLNGEDDAAEAKLLLAKTAGRFQGLVNFIIERPLGVPSGESYSSYGYAASVSWLVAGQLRLGAEAFGDLGDDHHFLSGPQGAYLGPQIKWEGRPKFSPVDIVVDAGWLKSIGADRLEAKSQARIAIEFEKHF
jgi:hypothetical protein